MNGPFQWTPEWELRSYWDRVMADQKEIDRDRAAFSRDLGVFTIGPPGAGAIVDIGAGPFGGVFGEIQFSDKHRRIIVDPLATEYQRRYGRLPPAKLIDAYAHDMPMPDGEAAAVFCIEALDHCNSVGWFGKAAAEIIRILAPGGILYFMIPLRPRAREGHPLSLDAISIGEMEASFRPLAMVRRSISKPGLYLTMKKPGEKP